MEFVFDPALDALMEDVRRRYAGRKTSGRESGKPSGEPAAQQAPEPVYPPSAASVKRAEGYRSKEYIPRSLDSMASDLLSAADAGGIDPEILRAYGAALMSLAARLAGGWMPRAEAGRVFPAGIYWPRFADRRPMRFGDRFETDEGTFAFAGCSFIPCAAKVGKLPECVVFGVPASDPAAAPEVVCIYRGRRYFARGPVIGTDMVPIEPGDLVYGSDGTGWRVVSIDRTANHQVAGVDKDGRHREMRAGWLTHTPPPSVAGDPAGEGETPSSASPAASSL